MSFFPFYLPAEILVIYEKAMTISIDRSDHMGSISIVVYQTGQLIAREEGPGVGSTYE